MATRRRTNDTVLPAAPARFAVDDIIILDSAAYRFARRQWRVTAVDTSAGEYSVVSVDEQQERFRGIPFDMALAPDETPKSSIWLNSGTVVQYIGRQQYAGFMQAGDFGIVLDDKPTTARGNEGELYARVARLGGKPGMDNLTLKALPHRHLAVVPVRGKSGDEPVDTAVTAALLAVLAAANGAGS